MVIESELRTHDFTWSFPKAWVNQYWFSLKIARISRCGVGRRWELWIENKMQSKLKDQGMRSHLRPFSCPSSYLRVLKMSYFFLVLTNSRSHQRPKNTSPMRRTEIREPSTSFLGDLRNTWWELKDVVFCPEHLEKENHDGHLHLTITPLSVNPFPERGWRKTVQLKYGIGRSTRLYLFFIFWGRNWDIKPSMGAAVWMLP